MQTKVLSKHYTIKMQTNRALFCFRRKVLFCICTTQVPMATQNLATYIWLFGVEISVWIKDRKKNLCINKNKRQKSNYQTKTTTQINKKVQNNCGSKIVVWAHHIKMHIRCVIRIATHKNVQNSTYFIERGQDRVRHMILNHGWWYEHFVKINIIHPNRLIHWLVRLQHLSAHLPK